VNASVTEEERQECAAVRRLADVHAFNPRDLIRQTRLVSTALIVLSMALPFLNLFWHR
jgi:hypothetical protein